MCACGGSGGCGPPTSFRMFLGWPDFLRKRTAVMPEILPSLFVSASSHSSVYLLSSTLFRISSGWAAVAAQSVVKEKPSSEQKRGGRRIDDIARGNRCRVCGGNTRLRRAHLHAGVHPRWRHLAAGWHHTRWHHTRVLHLHARRLHMHARGLHLHARLHLRARLHLHARGLHMHARGLHRHATAIARLFS